MDWQWVSQWARIGGRVSLGPALEPLQPSAGVAAGRSRVPDPSASRLVDPAGGAHAIVCGGAYCALASSADTFFATSIGFAPPACFGTTSPGCAYISVPAGTQTWLRTDIAEDTLDMAAAEAASTPPGAGRRGSERI